MYELRFLQMNYESIKHDSPPLFVPFSKEVKVNLVIQIIAIKNLWVECITHKFSR